MDKPDVEVDLFIPCFIDQLYPSTGFNLVKVLEKAGCKVNYNPGQTCCGQPAFNAGYWKDSWDVGKKFIQDFPDRDRYVVAPSGSCVGFVRNHYASLFENTSLHNEFTELQERIYEFSEFMVGVLGVTDVGARLDAKATYHDACGALRECGIKSAPRQLLQHVKGLELHEMEACETCCGFGGTFAVKYEPISTAMADTKVNHALDTQAEYLISTDLSCLMHLEGYIKKQKRQMKVMHLVDVLATGW